VGEITALIFSGALSFEDGVRLVGARAEAMDIASGILESGMITIFYGGDANLGTNFICLFNLKLGLISSQSYVKISYFLLRVAVKNDCLNLGA
jgi:hypothetical protein